MKRKRGHKSSSKKSTKSDASDTNSEDNQSLDQADTTQVQVQVQSEVSVEKKIPEPKPEKPTVPNTDPAWKAKPTGTAVYNRVKVKVKSSKLLEQVQHSSDARSLSETDKSKLQSPPVQLNGTTLEKEKDCLDEQNSVKKTADSDKNKKKLGSIKIKSSRALTTDALQSNIDSNKDTKSQTNMLVSDTMGSSDTIVPSSSPRKELKKPRDDPRYNEKELHEALAVIKKVMKMEAAGPFNDPVDPVALGIPDYFDVIDTPMDFGTICHDLESGSKYMNSEDVYKDVQFIWGNCNKYNNKGDYIMELMKRVKKAFMKSWSAAGLYSDVREDGSMGNVNSGDVHDKAQSKSKSKHKRRRHGFELHKSDCLCAVCVVTRRRRERAVDENMDLVATNVSEQVNVKEISLPDSEDTASNGEHSPQTVKHDEMKESDEKKYKPHKQRKISQSKKVKSSDYREGCDGESMSKQLCQLLPNAVRGKDQKYKNGLEGPNVYPDKVENAVSGTQEIVEFSCDSETNETVLVEPEESKILQQYDEKHVEASEVSKKRQVPPLEENYAVLPIVSSLFPSNAGSVWKGHHSLFRYTGSMRASPIHLAITAIMKR